MKFRYLVITCTAIMAIGVFPLQSCLSMDEKQPGSEANEATSSASMPDISNHEDQIVHIEGTFQGWTALACQFSEDAAPYALTRSDWLIRFGSYCYYVTGGAPEDLEAYNPEHIGKRISLEARPVRKQNGKLYLEYISSKGIP